MIYFDKKIISYLKYYKDKNMYARDFYSLIDENGYLKINNLENLSNLVRVEHVTLEEMKDTYNVIKLIFKKNDGTEYFQIWRCGRFVKVLCDNLHKEVNHTYIENITSIILGEHTFELYIKKNNLSLEKSNDISYYYFRENYIDSYSGSLQNSCMNDTYHPTYYDAFNEIVNLLILIDNSSGKILGRALIWETDKGYYLDRIYLNDDLMKYGFEMYARSHFNVKYSYYSNSKISIKSCVYANKINFDRIESPYLAFPYFDTMKYISYDVDTERLCFSNVILDNSYNSTEEYNNIYKVMKEYLNREENFLPFPDVEEVRNYLKNLSYNYIKKELKSSLPFTLNLENVKICNSNEDNYDILKKIFNIEMVILSLKHKLYYELNRKLFEGYLFKFNSIDDNNLYSIFFVSNVYDNSIENLDELYKNINKALSDDNIIVVYFNNNIIIPDYPKDFNKNLYYLKIPCNYIPILSSLFISNNYLDFFYVIEKFEHRVYIDTNTKLAYFIFGNNLNLSKILSFIKKDNNIQEIININDMNIDDIKNIIFLNNNYLIETDLYYYNFENLDFVIKSICCK